MRFDTLEEWLRWQETLHPRSVDLGLARCVRVAARMGLERPPFAVLTVAGTNGKGSCAAMLDAMLRAAGYRTGLYTTPHLRRYNERIRLDGLEASDAGIVGAFERIEGARGDVSLTYFEFGTLAALDLFARARVDAAVLEVGLGGRLDAVNVVDADVAVVTTVDLDHMEWLGPDRETVGREKAGIFRAGRPAVYGDVDPPQSLERRARVLGARLQRLEREYRFEAGHAEWRWQGPEASLEGLPPPALSGAHQLRNAAAAIAALRSLGERLTVSEQAVRRGLAAAALPARFQVFAGEVERVVDVAHNPQAARSLAQTLSARVCRGRTLAVLAMLADKDAPGVVESMAAVVHAWYVGGLAPPRGASGEALAARIRGRTGEAPVRVFEDVPRAYAAALEAARPGDRVVAFGSFCTAAEALCLET